MPKTKKGKRVECELGLVGGMYYNNYGVECWKLEDGNVFMQAFRMGRMIHNHCIDIPFDYFVERFRDNSKGDADLVIDALQFLDPEFEDAEECII